MPVFKIIGATNGILYPGVQLIRLASVYGVFAVLQAPDFGCLLYNPVSLFRNGFDDRHRLQSGLGDTLQDVVFWQDRVPEDFRGPLVYCAAMSQKGSWDDMARGVGAVSRYPATILRYSQRHNWTSFAQ